MMPALKRLSTSDTDFSARLDALLAFENAQNSAVEQTVADILADVRTRGDAAVLHYTRNFDRLNVNALAELELPRAEWTQALTTLPDEQRTALETAARRVRKYHEHQPLQSWQYEEPGRTEQDGAVFLGQKVTPLDRVGLYVPGGKAAPRRC